jgi:hypothetical protein
MSMAYDTFRNKFKSLLVMVGENPEGFSTHSMRRGGATELRERDPPEALIAQHGQWRSSKCMMQYFDGTVEFARRAEALRKAELLGSPVRRQWRSDVDCLDCV